MAILALAQNLWQTSAQNGGASGMSIQKRLTPSSSRHVGKTLVAGLRSFTRRASCSLGFTAASIPVVWGQHAVERTMPVVHPALDHLLPELPVTMAHNRRECRPHARRPSVPARYPAPIGWRELARAPM